MPISISPFLKPPRAWWSKTSKSRSIAGFDAVNYTDQEMQGPGADRRTFPRSRFPVPVDYVASGRVYRDYVRDVSLAGASIGCSDFFIPGERISIAFPLAESLNQINGEIVWVDTNVFGVAFKSVGPKCKELSASPREPVEEQPTEIWAEAKKPGKIKTKRVRWYRSPSTEVIKYRLYWSVEREVDYDSDYVELGNVAEAILPDDIPSFPLITGTIHLGITALSKAGNESDMTKISASLDFTVPEAPQKIWVED
jgi:hypothetical protein